MPKISLLTTGLAIGGAETQTVMLAKALKGRGWQVEIISMLPPKALTGELNSELIPVLDLKMRRGWPDPRAIWRLAAHLRSSRPHVLHCHMVHANLLGRVTRLFCDVPVLVNTAHSIQEGGFWRELAYRFSDPLCDLLTQVSEAGAKRYASARISGRQKTIWVPNAVDLTRFQPNSTTRAAVRHAMNWGERFVWIAVGNLRRPKNYPNLLSAFARLRQTQRGAKLVIAGAGELESQLHARKEELGLGEAVEFLGLRADVAQLLAGADGYVMSSDFEGTPMALLEAAASGLALVATDVGGNRDVIAGKPCGLLVPPANSTALATAMEQIMKLSRTARENMGQAARRRVETHFSLDGIIAKWDNIYRQLLSVRALESRSQARRLPFLKSDSQAG